MWIKSPSFKNNRDHLKRARAYSRHIVRNRSKFSRSVLFWIGEERLHDAKLTHFSFDDSLSTAQLEFRYTGQWVGEPPKRPKSRHLVLKFNGVQRLTIESTKRVGVSVANLSYIQGELNTHPDITPRSRQKSMALYFVGEEPLEIEVIFKSAVLTGPKARLRKTRKLANRSDQRYLRLEE